MTRRKVYLILHNIRSAHNVGSIFRTADAAGVSKIYLTGYTPAPLDRFGRARKDLAKVSLGAEEYVPWEHFEDAEAAIAVLKKAGAEIIAVEQAAGSVDYKKVRPSGAAAFIFGSEVGGIPASLLKKCDRVCEIPMRGKKESLNVAVAAGIILFRSA